MKKRCGFFFGMAAVLLLFAVTMAGCDNITANNDYTEAVSTPTLQTGTYNCVWNGHTGILILTALKTVSSFKVDGVELITSGMWNQTDKTLTITLTYINGSTDSLTYTVTSSSSFSGYGENWRR